MCRTMINEYNLATHFWAEGVNIACYVMNISLIRKGKNKTPYEIWKGRTPNISYLRVFGCKCYILNTKENLDKFDPKSQLGIFLGYSSQSRAYKVYNKTTKTIEESIHVKFDENPSISSIENDIQRLKIDEDDDLEKSENMKALENSRNLEALERSENQEPREAPKNSRLNLGHPIDQIIGDPFKGVTTRGAITRDQGHMAFVSQLEPLKVEEALEDESWISAMQEELGHFVRNKVWNLVPRPTHQTTIGTKWVFRNKKG